MSSKTPIKADIDPDAVPPRAPKNRDELVAESRARGEAEPETPPPPADAADETADKDAKARLIPTPRTDPATTVAVNEDQSDAGRDPADTRAGPGDAGGQRSPDIVPQVVDQPRANGRGIPMFLGLIVGAILILAILAWV